MAFEIVASRCRLFSPPPCGEGEGWGSRGNVKTSTNASHLPTPHPTLPHKGGGLLEDDAWIADALIAINQVDLLGLDLPGSAVAHDAIAGPAGEYPRLITPEFADQKI